MKKDKRQKKKKGRSVQELLGIRSFTQYGLAVGKYELLFYLVSPTNISVLSHTNIEIKINYPVMYTPESPQKYLRRNFDGGYSQSGIPFLDYRCDTGCTNRMIYGHNMKNRTMFGTLIHYTDPAYAAAHSVITFQTADGLEKYTAFAVVPVQKTDAWYSFIRAADGAEFAKQVALLRSKSLYDTGVTPVYGQQLLTLSTCYGSGKDGRLIVAAAQL